MKEFDRSQPGTPYLAPQVGDVDHTMSVMVEESFGGGRYHESSGRAEAIRLMNDSPYGLTASIWTTGKRRHSPGSASRSRYGLYESLRLSGPGTRLDRSEGYRARLYAVGALIRKLTCQIVPSEDECLAHYSDRWSIVCYDSGEYGVGAKKSVGADSPLRLPFDSRGEAPQAPGIQ